MRHRHQILHYCGPKLCYLLFQKVPQCPAYNYSLLVTSITCLFYSLLGPGTWSKPVCDSADYFSGWNARKSLWAYMSMVCLLSFSKMATVMGQCWEILVRVCCNVKVVQETVSNLLDINGLLQKIPTFKISVYILEKHAIWQQRDMMTIFSPGISNSNIPTQFVALTITLKICRCDDSNYGWYFMCGMLTVWINQTKMLDELRQRQVLITEKLRLHDRSIETFLLQDQDRRPESGHALWRTHSLLLQLKCVWILHIETKSIGPLLAFLQLFQLVGDQKCQYSKAKNML